MEEAKFKAYKGVCPVCGEMMWICKSIGMKIGINAGIGNCPYCKVILYMSFNEERQEMNLEKFKDYQERHCKECEENAKTDGASSGI